MLCKSLHLKKMDSMGRTCGSLIASSTPAFTPPTGEQVKLGQCRVHVLNDFVDQLGPFTYTPIRPAQRDRMVEATLSHSAGGGGEPRAASNKSACCDGRSSRADHLFVPYRAGAVAEAPRA